MRRCIACYTSYPQDEILRFTLDDKTLVPDIDKKNDGRGVYLCKKRECLDVALKKNQFNRAFKTQVDIETNLKIIEEMFNNTKEE